MERKKPAPRSKVPVTRATRSRASKPLAPKARSTRAKAPPKPASAARARRAKKVLPASPVAARRAVYIDVENTSGEDTLLRVLEHLQIDRRAQPTQVTAVGNWKSVGTKVARMLASLGAELVHSAPAVGVRDWSDLWIAVAAGRWLATAAPGDQLDLVSDDRAFDAVGDAAAALGIVFRRISHRSMPGSAPPAAVVEPRPRPRRHRGGRRRGRGVAAVSSTAQPLATPAVTPSVTPLPSVPDNTEAEAHAASHEHIRAALVRLSGGTGRWINLDAVANALKTAGFTRPPGSPRLVTRLRMLKDVEVTPNGMVRLLGESPSTTEESAAAAPAAARRPRRRSRRPRQPSTAGETDAPPPTDTPA